MLDAMVHDGLTNPFSGKQMFVEATEIGDELEMTRVDLDRWAALARAGAEGDRRGSPLGGDPAGDGQARKGDTVAEIDKRPAAPTLARAPRSLPGLVSKEGSPPPPPAPP
jgi:acetyl-CoA C-acetyltransferase